MLDRAGIECISDKQDAAAPSQDDVCQALERIVASAEFRASPHLAAFLRFSVEKSLAGEGANIKAYSVATSVLGRPPTFDPQADPIVRVEATRLRRALERYYLHEGLRDPICINIPRGRYVAFFSFRNAMGYAMQTGSAAHRDEEESAGDAPHVMKKDAIAYGYLRNAWLNLSGSERRSMTVLITALVGALVTWSVIPQSGAFHKPVEQALMLQPVEMKTSEQSASIVTRSISGAETPRQRVIFATLQLTPFDSYSDSPEHHEISHRITHLIAEKAPEFDGIPVMDPDGPMAADPPNEHLYALMGTVLQESTHPEHIEISVRLVQRPSFEIVWTKVYHIENGVSLFDEKLESIRNDIVQSIAGLNGAIRVDDARRHIDESVSSTPCQLCLAESDIALRTHDPERMAKSIACLKTLSEKAPNESLVFKQLAALRLLDTQNSMERIASLASARQDLETAVSLAPADRIARQQLDQLRIDDRLTQKP